MPALPVSVGVGEEVAQGPDVSAWPPVERPSDRRRQRRREQADAEDQAAARNSRTTSSPGEPRNGFSHIDGDAHVLYLYAIDGAIARRADDALEDLSLKA